MIPRTTTAPGFCYLILYPADMGRSALTSLQLKLMMEVNPSLNQQIMTIAPADALEIQTQATKLALKLESNVLACRAAQKDYWLLLPEVPGDESLEPCFRAVDQAFRYDPLDETYREIKQ